MVGGLLSSEADEEGARGRAVARATRARVSTTACELSQALRKCRRALAAVVEAGRRSQEPGAAREVAERKPSHSIRELHTVPEPSQSTTGGGHQRKGGAEGESTTPSASPRVEVSE